ncbi:GATA zinc finger domain-containing protein 10 isoform X2 [Stomoxys calcitrans]|nr:GATA zinc finger domain-containing protein 10 isoform X2 [Stomoxys calcitrans]
MRAKLKDVYNVVQEVNVMDSQDSANLALLSRPELGVTFTKLHCWRLVQFEKCVFLDADTLILQNCDELFEREEFSAAPDVSWPDCFNSGVFVYKPSQATFDKIVEFAVKYGSFDGGDQGLLNQYFADWATSDIRKRLPFLYNVTAYASYCYLPAFKQFRDKIKILHFAGKMKPWLIHFNSQSRVASVPSDYSHANDLIQLWWNIFFDHVHGQLTTNMRYYCPTIMPWKSNYDYIRMQQQQELEQKHSEYHHNDNHNDNDNNNSNYNQHKEYVDEFYENQEIKFHDPWEDYYRKLEEEAEMQRIKAEEEARRHFEWQQQQEQQQQHQQHHMGEYNQNYEETPREEQWQGHQQQQAEDYGNSESHYQQPEDQNIHTFTQEHEHISDHSHHWREDYHSEEVEHQHQSYDHHDPPEHYAHETYQESHIPSPTYNEDCKCSSNIEAEQLTHVLSNYDSSELNLRDQDIERATDISQEPAMTSRLTADQVTISDDEETEEGEEVGLAGALSQLRLGEQRTPEQEAYEHMMRRQCWESGQVDYMGRDSFENIWKRIQQTMDSKPQAPAAAAAEDEKKASTNLIILKNGDLVWQPHQTQAPSNAPRQRKTTKQRISHRFK